MTRTFRGCRLLAVVTLLLCAAARPAAQDPARGQQTPSFRTSVTAVPVEVRVVDKDGRPITDLKREDFTILENGVPQEIAHFFAQQLAASAPAANLRARGEAPLFEASLQGQRVFLILLGTRALGEVELHPETLNGLVRFVSDRLLPQDQVAVLAPPALAGGYNRVIEFTADHAKVAAFLETFRRSPRGGPSSRPAAPGAASPVSLSLSSAALEKSPAIRRDLGLEELVRAWGRKPIGTELDYLYFAIKYLRYMPGDKHLVFVTERGPNPTWDQAKHLASFASDARVVLDTIQVGEWVGGMDLPRLFGNAPDPTPGGTPEGRGDALPKDGNTLPAVAASAGHGGPAPAPTDVQQRAIAAMHQYLAVYDLRYVAGQTGGQAAMLKDADAALERIETSTRASYLLAYYPAGDAWDGQFRTLKVLVNRPGAQVLFRHGYYARREADVIDPRRVLSNTRIDSAGSQVGPLHEIDVSVAAAFRRAASGGGGEVTASLSVDVSRLAWDTDADGMHVAHVEVAVYCADGGDTVVGQVRRMLNISLTDASYARVMKERFGRDFVVSVTKVPRLVKVVVYDYDADRVGSALTKIPR